MTLIRWHLSDLDQVALRRLCLTFREPVGVCGLITPWNFPTAIPAWKGFHALVCGNTIVLKPAEDVPLCASALVGCLDEAGFPPGVVNLVQGPGEPTGAALVAHADVDLISFTGSADVGGAVAAACARRHANVSLELGGKNAQVVFADADMELALDGVLWGRSGPAASGAPRRAGCSWSGRSTTGVSTPWASRHRCCGWVRGATRRPSSVG